MKDKYYQDRSNTKESSRGRSEHSMQERSHAEKDMMVKRGQDAMKSMGGRAPRLSGNAMDFNAYQCNNGTHAQEFAKELTRGLDEKAFPVRQTVNKDQEMK